MRSMLPSPARPCSRGSPRPPRIEPTRPVTYLPKLSPSALNRFLACEYRSYLDMLERRGELDAKRRPPPMQLLLELGEEFEDVVLERMRSDGLRVISLDDPGATRRQRADRTIDAMRAGYDVIHQGCFANDEWVGYPDFLIRIEEPSDLGDWSYEVHDAKLGGHRQTQSHLPASVLHR